MARKASAEKAVRDIRRRTRRQFSAEEKIRSVLEGVRGEVLPAGKDTADFILSLTPEAPAPGSSTISGDVFLGVTPGSTVKFKLTARNDFVEHRREAQLFTVDIHVLGDAVTVLDVRKVYVVVPPEIEVIVVE